MEKKKNPRKDVYRLTHVWFSLGLVISLSMIITAFEWKSYQEIVVPELSYQEQEATWEPPVVPPEAPKPKPKPVLPKPVPVPDDDPVEITPPDLSFDNSQIPDYVPVEDGPPVEEPDAPPVDPYEVEQVPLPVGGYEAFYKYVEQNLKYPKQAQRVGIEGKVFVQFVIDKDGSITDLNIIRGIGAGCDEEVIQLMDKAPKWVPGKQRGHPVRVRMVLPITFKLN